LLMKIGRKLGTVFDGTLDVTGGIGSIIVASLMVVVVIAVTFRYFLHTPLLWVIRFGEICLLYLAFLGAAYVLRKEAHVKMDLVLSRLKPTHQALMTAITSIFAIIVFLVVIYYSSYVTWEAAVKGYYKLAYLNIPEAYVTGVIPVGCTLLAIQFARRAYKNLKLWRSIKKSGEF